MWNEHNWTERCIRTSVLMKRSVSTNSRFVNDLEDMKSKRLSFLVNEREEKLDKFLPVLPYNYIPR